MKKMEIGPFLVKASTQIEEKLAQLIPSQEREAYSALFASARYSLLSPGKRLRPLLVLAVAESYGASWDQALIPACAIEMIHTYSLIHDDLPCMDNDDLRRGKPTLHKVYPEWHALLTGDYLLTYAFEIVASAQNVSAEQKIALIRSLSHHAGASGMIGGQFIDLANEGKSVEWSLLEQMHRGKTASLIAAALECGGIVAHASHEEISLLTQAGLTVGVAFQLIDDILDETSTSEELGKSIGSDRKKQKATAISVLGIKQAQDVAEDLLKTAKRCLDALSRPTPLLRSLFEQMTHRRK